MLQFDGSDYNHKRDFKRLNNQLSDIFNLMSDGKWRSLRDIELLLKWPQASISAQLRNLRKERFGAHKINKRYISEGLYQYQLEVNNGK